jgi:Iap family predicted aminopeptidase
VCGKREREKKREKKRKRERERVEVLWITVHWGHWFRGHSICICGLELLV